MGTRPRLTHHSSRIVSRDMGCHADCEDAAGGAGCGRGMWECVLQTVRLMFTQCLSGRGDKDVEQISELLPQWADKLDWHVSPHAAGAKKPSS